MREVVWLLAAFLGSGYLVDADSRLRRLSSASLGSAGRIKVPYLPRSSDCPEGWIPARHSGLCYTIPASPKDQLSYGKAKASCGAVAGRLAAFGTEAEMDEFVRVLDELMGPEEWSQVWLGCSDERTEGSYVCPSLKGSPFFRWAPYNGEPNGGTEQNCLIGLRWPKGTPLHNLDVRCNSRHPYRVTACATDPCSEQAFGSWSPCTVTCGVGATVRESLMPGCPSQAGTCSQEACPAELPTPSAHTLAHYGLDKVPLERRFRENPGAGNRRSSFAGLGRSGGSGRLFKPAPSPFAVVSRSSPASRKPRKPAFGPARGSSSLQRFVAPSPTAENRYSSPQADAYARQFPSVTSLFPDLPRGYGQRSAASPYSSSNARLAYARGQGASTFSQPSSRFGPPVPPSVSSRRRGSSASRFASSGASAFAASSGWPQSSRSRYGAASSPSDQSRYGGLGAQHPVEAVLSAFGLDKVNLERQTTSSRGAFPGYEAVPARLGSPFSQPRTYRGQGANYGGGRGASFKSGQGSRFSSGQGSSLGTRQGSRFSGGQGSAFSSYSSGGSLSRAPALPAGELGFGSSSSDYGGSGMPGFDKPDFSRFSAETAGSFFAGSQTSPVSGSGRLRSTYRKATDDFTVPSDPFDSSRNLYSSPK